SRFARTASCSSTSPRAAKSILSSIGTNFAALSDSIRGVGALFGLFALMAGLSATASGQDVPPVDFSQIAPDDFGDDELAFAYYLAHFPILANSVRMSEPDRGFIDHAVWREPDWQTRHNARVMENVLSLAFFYATDRPWNPYYAHPSVRQR